MQGQSPAVSISAQTVNSPAQNANKEWTCQRWFYSIDTKVSAKTHRYVGKFVAAVTLPIIFIPSLARDLFCGTKNLYQRAVSKTPVVNQVSTKGTIATSAATQSDNIVVLPPVVLPESVRAYSSHTPPTIEQLRKDFPELNQVFTAMEASAKETEQQLAEHKMMNRKLKADLDQSRCALGNMVIKCDREQKLQRQLEESNAKNFRYTDEINDLNRVIERQNADFKDLLATHQKLTDRMNKLLPGHSPFAKLDPVVDEPDESEPQDLSCPDKPHSPDQAEVIVLENEITSSSRDDAELVDIVVLSDAIAEPKSEDQDEPVLPITTPDAQESQEFSLVAEASDSDDSYETISKSDVAAAMGIPDITITDYDQSTEVKVNVE